MKLDFSAGAGALLQLVGRRPGAPALTGLAALAAGLLAAADIQPEKDSAALFNADGSFTLGSAAGTISPNASVSLNLDGNRRVTINQQFSFETLPWVGGSMLRNKKLSPPSGKASVEFEGDIPTGSVGRDGKYLLEARLDKPGVLSVRTKYSIPEGVKAKGRGDMLFALPFQDVAGKKFHAGRKEYSFSSGTNTTKTPADYILPRTRDIREITFFKDEPSRLKVSVLKGGAVYVYESKMSGGPGQHAVFGIEPDKDGGLEFTLDASAEGGAGKTNSSDIRCGIDFWSCNRMHVPNYSNSRNLIQNPSFEAGLRYFRYRPYGSPVHGNERLYALDDTESRSGKRSLAIMPDDAAETSAAAGTFVIPVTPGRDYTFSFYARGNKETGLGLRVSGLTADHKAPVKWRGGNFFKLSRDWQRHSLSFTAPNSAVGIYFNGILTNRQTDNGGSRIWIDDLQLEEGGLSGYTESPLCAELVTSDPDNFLEKGRIMDARLNIHGRPGLSGEAEISLENFFGETLWKNSRGFTVGEEEETVIRLPFDSVLMGGEGIFIVTAKLRLPDGFACSDWFRFSVMSFLNNTHKNRAIFTSNPSSGQPRIEDVLKRYTAIGIGGIGMHGDEEFFVRLATEKYKLFYSGNSLITYSADGGSITAGGKNLVSGLMRLTPGKVTKELLDKVEEASYQKALAMPWVCGWWLIGEPDTSKFDNLGMKDVVSLYKAAARGVKRAGPSLKYIAPGPWNMMPAGGTRWYEEFLSAGGRDIEWDAFDMHPYRTMPEAPDLDDDISVFLAMLDKFGFGSRPVYFAEGIYYPPYYIPRWGLDCYNGGASADHYYAGMPSYHLGWGEMISAAFYARSWLAALKYADRIKCFEGWSTSERFFFDLNLTPFAVQKVPNTIGWLLGNADFRHDIRFAPGVRCYVFEDAEKRPVAAVWSHFPDVDKGRERPPVINVPPSGVELEVFDMMGNRRGTAAADTPLKTDAPPFPIFIRGKPGSLSRLSGALRDASVEGAKTAPVKINVKITDPGTLALSFVNILDKPYKGRMSCRCGQFPLFERELSIQPRGSETISAALDTPLSQITLSTVTLDIKLKSAGGESFSVSESFSAFAVSKRKRPLPPAADSGGWADTPEIRLKNIVLPSARKSAGEKAPAGPNDLSASFKMLWDEEFLYVLAFVNDDIFISEDRKGGLYNRWNNDTLQLFFDTLTNARGKSAEGFDTDDYNYDFYPLKTGELLAYRRFAPERQMCGGLETQVLVPEIKTAFKREGALMTYGIAIPAAHLKPFQLRKNSSCGFALLVNDNDDTSVKQSLTLTPAGTSPYMSPHLYPVMLLVE